MLLSISLCLHHVLPDGLLQGHFSTRRRTSTHWTGVLKPSHIPQNTQIPPHTAQRRWTEILKKMR